MNYKKTLRIIFAGTPDFAVPSLQALIDAGHDICAVYTQPDRPAGRGQKLKQSAVKILALKHQLPVLQPRSLRDKSVQEELFSFKADVMIVAAYGLIIPKEILSIGSYGCINIHSSLLPRWRGAAPIQRALLAGDKETGITIMKMDEGLDTGNILFQMSCPITEADTSQTLHDKLAALGSKALLTTLEQLNALEEKPQQEDKTCYAEKIKKEEAKIQWQHSAATIERSIRAFQPWPVAYTTLDNEIIRIWKATVITHSQNAEPGTILQADKNGILVATGNNALKLQTIQFSGAKALDIADILNAKKSFFQINKVFS